MSVDASRQLVTSGTDSRLAGRDRGGPVIGSPFVAMPYLASAVRRRWRLWASVAALGVLAGVVLSLISPPPLTATTTLLLGHSTKVEAFQAMVTDQQFLRTTAVARGAIDRLGLRVAPGDFFDEYKVLSQELLQISARGPGAAEATRRADAVASSFLAFRAEEFERQAKLSAQAFETRQNPLVTELSDVNNRINSMGPDQQSDAAIRAFGDLLTRRGTLSDQISILRRQIQDVATDAQAIIDKSRVIDPATPDSRSATKMMLLNGLAGLIGGFALGIGWVVCQAIVSDRVRRRDDVADALGVPVAVSIGRFPLGRRWGRQRIPAQLTDPGPEIARMAQHLQSALLSSGAAKPSLITVSLDSDVPAAAAVATAAAAMAVGKTQVLVVDLSTNAALGTVLGIPVDTTSAIRLKGSEAVTWVAFPPAELARPDRELAELMRRANVVFVLTSLDPALGAVNLGEWASKAVVVVSNGRSTVQGLRSVAQMLDAAGVELDSAMLVGADKGDESYGAADWRIRGPIDIPASRAEH